MLFFFIFASLLLKGKLIGIFLKKKKGKGKKERPPFLVP